MHTHLDLTASFLNPTAYVMLAQVTCTDFIITTSIDGFIKFWKKQPRGIEFVKQYRAHVGAVDGEEADSEAGAGRRRGGAGGRGGRGGRGRAGGRGVRAGRGGGGGRGGRAGAGEGMAGWDGAGAGEGMAGWDGAGAGRGREGAFTSPSPSPSPSPRGARQDPGEGRGARGVDVAGRPAPRGQLTAVGWQYGTDSWAQQEWSE